MKNRLITSVMALLAFASTTARADLDVYNTEHAKNVAVLKKLAAKRNSSAWLPIFDTDTTKVSPAYVYTLLIDKSDTDLQECEDQRVSLNETFNGEKNEDYFRDAAKNLGVPAVALKTIAHNLLLSLEESCSLIKQAGSMIRYEKLDFQRAMVLCKASGANYLARKDEVSKILIQNVPAAKADQFVLEAYREGLYSEQVISMIADACNAMAKNSQVRNTLDALATYIKPVLLNKK